MRFRFTKSLACAGAALILLNAAAALSAQESAAPELASTATEADRLYPGDTVVFNIRQDPEPGGPVTLPVTSQGQLRFPVTRADESVVVTLDVEGKPVQEVAQRIKSKLDEKYYFDASVDLEIKDKTRKQGQVFFDGAVRNSIIPLEPGAATTLYEALIKAGPTEFANTKSVIVRRFNPLTRETREIKVNAEDAKKDKSKDLPLQDGDRIEVKEKFFNFGF